MSERGYEVGKIGECKPEPSSLDCPPSSSIIPGGNDGYSSLLALATMVKEEDGNDNSKALPVR
jgi:hypothetical protein